MYHPDGRRSHLQYLYRYLGYVPTTEYSTSTYGTTACSTLPAVDLDRLCSVASLSSNMMLCSCLSLSRCSLPSSLETFNGIFHTTPLGKFDIDIVHYGKYTANQQNRPKGRRSGDYFQMPDIPAKESVNTGSTRRRTTQRSLSPFSSHLQKLENAKKTGILSLSEHKLEKCPPQVFE
jgi:hypothetical protein